MSNTIQILRGKTCGKVIQPVIFRGYDDVQPFDPITLFMNGEQGVYFDPSDLSTLFQDSFGTTPVTAAGQPVGLMLDKSQGLVRGPELVTNGDFSAGLTGWKQYPSAHHAVLEGGGVRVKDIAGTDGGISTAANVAVVAGRRYELTFDVLESTGMYHANMNNGLPFNSFTGTGAKRISWIATHNNQKLDLFQSTPDTSTLLTNISVRELPGNHASQPTASKRPILQESGGLYSLKFDEVDDELVTTFPAPLGSNCTIGIAVKPAATILTGQTVDATYVMNTDNYGVVIVDDALTPKETANLTEWLNAKAGN